MDYFKTWPKEMEEQNKVNKLILIVWNPCSRSTFLIIISYQIF